MKIITIWYTAAGISVLGVYFCGVCGRGGLGWGKTLNRLNDYRALFEVRSQIEKSTPRSGPGKLLTLVGYSSILPNILESRRPLRVSMPRDQCVKSLVSV